MSKTLGVLGKVRIVYNAAEDWAMMIPSEPNIFTTGVVKDFKDETEAYSFLAGKVTKNNIRVERDRDGKLM